MGASESGINVLAIGSDRIRSCFHPVRSTLRRFTKIEIVISSARNAKVRRCGSEDSPFFEHSWRSFQACQLLSLDLECNFVF